MKLLFNNRLISTISSLLEIATASNWELATSLKKLNSQAGHTKYVEDMQHLIGSYFDHDDSINDRAQGGRLENGYIGTAALWKQTFNQVCVIIAV